MRKTARKIRPVGPVRPSSDRPAPGWPLFLILGLAFFLRAWGVFFGLPDLYHADEPIVVNHALAYGSGDFNPHFFKIPPLVSYLLFGVYGFYFLFLKLIGRVQDVLEFQIFFLSDPGSFYGLARVIFGVLCGTATVYLLYRLLKRFFSKDHGLIAAFFLGSAFLHVRDSHYIYADIPLLFVLAACFFPIFEMLEKPRRQGALVFGLLLGTAVALKYNGVFIAAPFLLARFLSKKKGRSFIDADLIFTGLVSLLAFGLLNPYSWLDARYFFRELIGQSQAEGSSGVLHPLVYSLNGGMGIPLLALSLAGLGWALIRGDAKRRVLACFVIVYYGVLCFFSQPYDRYVLPLIPFLAFFAADILMELVKKRRFPGPVLWALVVLAAIPSLGKSVLSDQLFARKDIRTVARERAEGVIPAGSKVALDVAFFMPRLKSSVKQLEEKKSQVLAVHAGGVQLKRLELMLEQAQKTKEPRYELYFLNRDASGEGFLFSQPAVPYDLKRLKELGIEYVFCARINESFEPGFYRDLAQNAVLMARFSPYKDLSRLWPIDEQPLTGGPFLLKELEARERNGQIIELYKLGGNPRT